MEREVFRLEVMLGARVPWRVLRILLARPYLRFSPSALATELNTSRASVLRVLQPLAEAGLVRGEAGMYRADTAQPMIRVLWQLFMLERRRNLQPRFKNAVDLFFTAVEPQVEVFIVFGSVARGLATAESDIDVCVVGEGAGAAERRFDFPPSRFEVHTYTCDGLAGLSDLVALDAVLNGVVLAGGDFVFDILRDRRWFPKAYLLYRLNNVQRFRERAAASQGEARRYYSELADLGLREIASVLFQGTTLSKPEARRGQLPDLALVEAKLAQAGDQIWLT